MDLNQLISRIFFSTLLFIYGNFCVAKEYNVLLDLRTKQVPINYSHNVDYTPQGYTIAINRYVNTQHTDLILQAKNDHEIILSNNYSYNTTASELSPMVLPKNARIFQSHNSTLLEQIFSRVSNVLFNKSHQAIAFLPKTNDTIILHPKKNALFAPNTQWGSFAIEFWLYPIGIYNSGSNIIEWNGGIIINNKLIPQIFKVHIVNNSLRWQFFNFFIYPEANNENNEKKLHPVRNIVIFNKKKLFSNTWSHHMLRYNNITSNLEYFINGISETIIPLQLPNKNPHITQGIPSPIIGKFSYNLSIGTNFTGLLDKIIIQKTAPTVLSTKKSRHVQNNGKLIIGPIDLHHDMSAIKIINAHYVQPEKTQFKFSYFVDTIGIFDNNKDNWIPFQPNIPLTDKVSGRYLFIIVDVLNNQTSTITNMLLKSFNVTYSMPDPLPPPNYITVTPHNGSVTVKWNRVYNNDIQGYMVYFGDQSLEYISETNTNIGSPIDAGNNTSITIDGLINNQIYYFSVISYSDKNNITQPVILSKEVYTRPSQSLNE